MLKKRKRRKEKNPQKVSSAEFYLLSK